tara:strand:- start:43 stop:573 length:531 start_codon:yes stop_codon:yes gene_type:complete
MKFTNSKTKYGLIAKIFHWTIFIILTLQFPLGVYLDDLEFSEFKLSIENWHVTIGMLIFYVTLARLIWKSLNLDPSKHNQVNNIQKYIAISIHYLFYIILLLITLSGIVKLLVSGDTINFIFFNYSIDYINFDLAKNFHKIHFLSSYFLIVLFILHLGAVIYHHFFLKDPIIKKII